MPMTANGIYHNLRESKYTISNGEIVFSFSSELYRNKFLNGYQNHRIVYKKNEQKHPLNMDTLADVLFYEKVEKRGFFVRILKDKLKSRISYDDLYKYALRKMQDKISPEWV